MRTLINFITICFVIVTGYFLLVKNPRVSELATTFYKQATSEFKTIPEQQSIPSVSLPGPLEKIGKSTSTVFASPQGAQLTRQGIVTETNKQRQAESVASLKESFQLDASAQVKADDILARQYFEHVAPDGKTVSDLVGEQGYVYIKIGENLALGNFKNDADVLAAWMASPGHRANIVDPAFTEIGVGVAHGLYKGSQVYVAVQHFGRPASTCPTIDPNLKASVIAGQQELTNLSTYLESLKKAIDQGRAQGKNMDDTITIYNQGVDTYQTKFNQVDALRTQYNREVSAFNSCAGK